MWKNFPLFPERASALAWQVDGLYFLLIAVSAFFMLLIFAAIFFFSVKYRRSVHPHAVQIEGSLPLELAWTLIPLGISHDLFRLGFADLLPGGPAAEGSDGGLRRSQAVDVEVRV